RRRAADQRTKSNESIKRYSQERACLFVRRFLQKVIAFDDGAASASGEKLVIKQSDKEQPCDTRDTEANLLDLEQNVPSKRSRYFHNHIGQHAHRDPAILGVAERLEHLGAPVRIVINPVQHSDRDAKLKNCDQNLLHSPKRSFQIRTDWRIASAVLFGFISQTNKQFMGRSGTSFS